MEINVNRSDQFSYGLINNLYTPSELDEIYDEIDSLYEHRGSPKQTNSAFDYDAQQSLKVGTGVILDKFYKNRLDSKILAHNRKIFSSEVTEKLESGDAYFENVKQSNHDFTLVNFYSNGEHYKAHRDQGLITAVTMLKIGDFLGGDFYFPKYGVTIPFAENSCVLFPCCVEHEALPITTDSGVRVTIAQFIGYSTKE